MARFQDRAAFDRNDGPRYYGDAPTRREPFVEIRVEKGDLARHPAKAVIVNLFEGVKSPGGGTGAVDKALDGAISQLIAEGEI